ncbi:MAG: hypothetical protein M3380_12380, partial [Chloroflexota bacterium]|nr:hypothetical protein [Chloroflexota bacterium]
MSGEICSLIVIVVLGALWLISRSHRQRQQQSDRGAPTLKRLLKPRPADDCPACQLHGILLHAAPVPP